MTIKNVAASAVLGLLFVSLVVIYLAVPQNDLVTYLSVVLMAVSLIVALSGGWREIGIMAGFAALASLVAAHFAGQARWGGAGGVILPILWLLVLMLISRWISRNILAVPKDRAILIIRTYSGTIYTPTPPLAPPLIPFIERRLATIPLYELSTDVRVEKVNTPAGHNIDAIDINIHYQVIDARRALGGIPNRGQTQSAIARELNLPLEAARNEVAFWERLLSHQMRLEVNDIVREVIYNNHIAQNAVEISKNREALAEAVGARLSELVQRWGVKILGLEFDRIDVNPEIARGIYLDRFLDTEAKKKRAEAENEATRIKLTREAEVEAEAERVRKLVGALVDAGVTLSPKKLEQIVINAILATAEWTTDFVHYPPPLVSEVKPASDKKNNGDKR